MSVSRIDEGIAGKGKKPILFIASLSVDEITTLEVIGVSGLPRELSCYNYSRKPGSQ